MNRPTRHEQARAILTLKGHQLASSILERRATSEADFVEAFNLERVDLVAEIPNPDAMLELGRTVPGPKDGLYIIDDGDSYRAYIQERGVAITGGTGLSFAEARELVIDLLIRLGGLPYRPPG